MVRKMIFVKNWSMLLHGLKRWYAALKSPLRTMFRGFDSVRIFSSPNIELESSLSYKLRLFKKKQSSCFSFRLKGNTFLKFSNFISWLRLSLTNINLPMLFTIRQQFSWQLRWMQLTFTPLSRDTRLFTQGHTCVNRMQGHTCVNRKPDSNNKR
jgi:hypothetical protein